MFVYGPKSNLPTLQIMRREIHNGARTPNVYYNNYYITRSVQCLPFQPCGVLGPLKIVTGVEIQNFTLT